ncbi:restriction endonuclease subunit S [Vibrio diabolicus]|uniref:restriction endonuclease subunit S n=1 Tax=Vibrio diabolicus TaxID=50719 RepID=UPI002160E193|nr:restriction endonuclease subunit S [Vibrio diabolicus]MCS0308259.1 restriction endonuclease subunit S [Vibrio diabolicus]
MTGRYKAYPEYKKSGVEWLDVIPEHWKVNTVKRLTDFQVGWTPSTGKDDNFVGDNLWANISDLKGKYLDDTAKKISDVAAQVASMDITPKGSLLYSFKLSVGAVSFANKDMYTNEAIASFLSTSKLPLSYLYYSLPIFVIENASTNIYGAKILNQELIKNATLIEPTFQEAEKIANFLDHETAKIDTLINKQEELIKLLKEKRQAVISHAVTKGLNPDAPMKDSGVEWLEEVPEHWVVCRLKHIKGKDKGSFVDGPFGSNLKSEHFINNGDVYVIESNFATTGSLDISKLKTISTSHFETISRSETKEGAIIIAKIGARYGMSSVLPQLPKRAVVSGNSLSLKVDEEKMDVQYSHQLLSHLKQEGAMDDGVNVTAQPALSLGQLNNLPFLCPPKEEQNDIVSFIQHQNESFSALIESATKMIELSKERKTALISAAVTGKIDVRDWQEPTYQESA